MKVLFLHGWQSIPGGVKPSYLAQHSHTVFNPALPDEDFEAAVRIAQAEYDRHRLDVVIGSSRGGDVAMSLDSGDTALVLLCPALAALVPRYNVAPSQPVPAVGLDREGRRAVATFRWGLVARWAADAKKAPINARAETAADKPSFAESLRQRRCLVPADGFYEWLRQGKYKHPFSFRLHDDRPFAFAGIWDAWRAPGGTLLLTCALLTTDANELVRPVHDRMPVIVPERDYDFWIDRKVQEPAELAPVLRPYPAEEMRAFAVGPTVNDPRNDGPACLAPAG
jgi:putative SOS response-associated peptidase YedK